MCWNYKYNKITCHSFVIFSDVEKCKNIITYLNFILRIWFFKHTLRYYICRSSAMNDIHMVRMKNFMPIVAVKKRPFLLKMRPESGYNILLPSSSGGWNLSQTWEEFSKEICIFLEEIPNLQLIIHFLYYFHSVNIIEIFKLSINENIHGKQV